MVGCKPLFRPIFIIKPNGNVCNTGVMVLIGNFLIMSNLVTNFFSWLMWYYSQCWLDVSEKLAQTFLFQVKTIRGQKFLIFWSPNKQKQFHPRITSLTITFLRLLNYTNQSPQFPQWFLQLRNITQARIKVQNIFLLIV